MSTFRTIPLAVFVVVVGLTSLAGCKPSATLVPVEGKVTLDSRPLADATVMLSPTRGNGPGPFVGTTNSDGQFALGPVGKPGLGAKADTYMLIITTVKQDPNSIDGGPPPTQKEVVPLKYRDGSQRFDVKEGGSKTANFDIKSK